MILQERLNPTTSTIEAAWSRCWSSRGSRWRAVSRRPGLSAWLCTNCCLGRRACVLGPASIAARLSRRTRPSGTYPEWERTSGDEYSTPASDVAVLWDGAQRQAACVPFGGIQSACGLRCGTANELEVPVRFRLSSGSLVKAIEESPRPARVIIKRLQGFWSPVS